jgi:spermidine synthase
MSIWIFALFFFSGLSALIYEVSWLRVLSLTFGNTAQATICVLAVFLGGLALGSWLGGRLADRLAQGLLSFYGKLELLIAALAPLVSLLVFLSPKFFPPLCHLLMGNEYLLSLVRFLLSGLVLLLPTMLMGATTPVLTKFLSQHYLAAQSFGRLYAANTLGAVAGSLLACFVGFAYLGLLGTIYSAACINVLIGSGAFILSKKFGKVAAVDSGAELSNGSADGAKDPTGDPTHDQADVPDSETVTEAELPFLCVLAALSGFAALSYEVLWIRLLRFYCISSTYAFTMMISSVILGLGLGSLIYQGLPQLGKNYRQKLVDLAMMQCAAAMCCACSLMLLPLSSLPLRARHVAGNPVGEVFGMTMVGLMFIVPASTVLGIAFPMIGGIAASSRKVGMMIGSVYSANTFGCVAGAILVGLLVQNSCSSFKCFQATIVLTALLGSLAFLKGLSPNRPAAIGVGLVPALATIWFACFVQDPLLSAMTSMKNPKVLAYGEDGTGLVMVLQHPGYRELRTGSTAVSSTRYIAKRYMRLLGCLPTLLHKHPKDVLLICFGTGTTAGAVASYKNVEHLDIVELSPEVIKAADKFADSNQDVLKSPKVSVYVNDGRNFLLCSDKHYDVMTFEPPPVSEAGVVNLYSREFYELARNHLNPGGIVCQWVPLFYESKILWKMMVKSAQEVFPYVSVWVPNNGEAVLIASDQPISIDGKQMQSNLENSTQLKTILAEVGLDDVNAVISTFVIGGQQLAQCLGDVRPVTDDRPQMEFFLPYVGEPIYVWDLEAEAGNPRKTLQQAIRVQNVDDARLDKYFQAMHLLRTGSRLLNDNQPESQRAECIDQVLRLAPENKFFQFAKSNSDAQG